MIKQEWVTPKFELLSTSQTLECDSSKVSDFNDLEECSSTPAGIPTS